MSLKRLNLRIRAHDALRVALAIRTIGDKHASINVLFDKDGQPTELFNSDNYCVAYVPLADSVVEWDAAPVSSMKFWVTLQRYPAKPIGDAELRIEAEPDPEAVPFGRLMIDNFPIGTLAYAGDNAMAGVRNVVPAKLEQLPIAPPSGMDVLHVASILKHTRKPPARAMPVMLPGGGYAFHYELDGGGEFIMVSLRGPDDEMKRFDAIVRTVREKAPF